MTANRLPLSPVLMLAALAAGAASASRASAQDIDIIEQHITVDVTGPSPDLSVDIDAVVDAPAGAVELYTLAFAIPVTAVTIDGSPGSASPVPGYPWVLLLTLPEPTGPDTTRHAIHVELRGAPSCGSLSGIGRIRCVRTADEVIFPPTATFYLMNLLHADGYTGALTVLSPSSMEVVAGEDPTMDVVDRGDGTKASTFALTVPTEYVWLAAGALRVVRSSSPGFPVSIYFAEGRGDPAKIEHAADIASKVLDWYAANLGGAPMHEARIVLVPRAFEMGGVGVLGAAFIGEYVFDDLDYLLEQGVAHELAHTWWGNLASPSDGHPFFTESFAESEAWRALGAVRGDAVRTAGVRMNAIWYMYGRPDDDDTAILDPELSSASPLMVYVVYHKGSTVVRTLEEIVGEEQFAEVRRALLARGIGGLSMDALLEDVRTVAGIDATPWADAWLRRTGFPHITVATTVTAGAPSSLTVHTESADGIDAVLPVELVAGDGTVTAEVLDLAAGVADATWSIDAAPVEVRIDPRWTMPRELTPALAADVTLDGVTDAADLVEVALSLGGAIPEERRVDGHYDPLYDVDRNGTIDARDLDALLAAAAP